MRIGIDCYAMQDPASAERGIGRYGRDLTRAILDAAPDDHFLLYAVDGMDTRGIPTAPNATVRSLPPHPAGPYSSRALDSAWLAGDFLHALLILSPMQSHVGLRRSSVPRLVSVVYDLIPETLPGLYSLEPGYQDAYEGYLTAVREYDQILTMSGSARDDLVRLRGFDPAKITVVGAAANPSFRPVTSEVDHAEDLALLRTHGIFRPGYVLNVGHEDPRKGSHVLARAFSMLPESLRSSTRLVYAYNAGACHRSELLSLAGTLGMTGAVGSPELLEELGMSPQVHFTGWCDDVSLRALYRNAAVMAFPSQYEGFGLPILEAMSCGCPVIAGANSSQREVLGNAGILVDAFDAKDIASAMEFMLESQAQWARSLRLGLWRAKFFAWPDVAAKALAAIRGK